MTIDQLIAQLDSATESERACAAEDIGSDDVGGALDALVARLCVEPSNLVRDAIVTALEGMSDERVPMLAAGLLSEDSAFVRNAGMSLLRARGPAALSAVTGAFARGDADVRKLAIDSLAGTQGGEADALYAQALGDADINVRITAVEAVGEQKKAQFRSRLEEMFEHEGEPMLSTALYDALLDVGTESTWPVIARRHPTLDSVPSFQREQWLHALARWGPPSALEIMAELAQRRPLADPAMFMDALDLLRQRTGFRTIPDRLLGALKTVCTTGALPSTRFRVLEWLGALTDSPAAGSFLHEQLESIDPVARLGAEAGLARSKPATDEAR